ncbi:Chromosome (plasmid) partitioning protein ParB [Bathymodiolus heckerae thiotrophic gill symbiont]|uniref:ParB/RepB/Spo0J family partition protein n=1 Tax=Bathymodiolus heckerae thiotrophic gill symbiont TaxID=1052212 RepID=UPI0010B22B5A|nr:ParB/RepB/Spo0J family partition protein [Bathymodiolus heckerae thiotrophic gill symbiont]SHN90006.1 Chromosome (plasmid) partitioning protein ParB [Bathymodiolus heckerae thiotrophic gill symbiont]
MAKISKLGRGLDILLGQVSNNNKDSENSMKMLSVSDLQRGKFQPRDDIDPETLNELAASITSQGVIQPLVVRKVTYDKYEIIAGERRWHAAQIAGLSEVPVIVREIDDQVALAIGLIENIQRESLTPLEEAKALQQLIEDFKMTHEEISSVVGRSRSSVTNLIRLLQLGADAKELLSKGKIEMGHARALLPLNEEDQSTIANQVVAKSLSVRQTEELVKRVLNPKTKTTSAIDPHISDLMRSLSKTLDSKTEIKTAGDKGKIIIHYKSADELSNILKHIN